MPDAVLAAAVFLVGLHGTSAAAAIQGDTGALTTWTYVLIGVAAFSLVGRRYWPLATLAVVTVANSVYLVLGYPYGPILISLLIAVYTVAVRCPTRTAAVASAGALAFLAGHNIIRNGMSRGLLGIVPASAWVVVPFACGVLLRMHKEAIARRREEYARQHADEERLRVAQEVHDIVGHGLSAIALQAEIALHVLPRRPEHAEVALAAISRASREALDELRATLAAVRRDDPDAITDETRAPLAGLARLDALVARMSDSGVAVTVESTGERPELRPAVDLAAYRVIQESLTNVLRHAGPAAVSVCLGYESDAMTIDVRDTGRGGSFVDGHGITGMRQRVEALGGTFAAGSGANGGFHVGARIPLT
jgi:signal transduction histidine kinase